MILQLFLSIILAFILNTNIFAATVSIGGSLFGFGASIHRGTDIAHMGGGSNYNANWKTGLKYTGINYSMSLSSLAELKVFLDFESHFGLEMGVGYSIKSIATTFRLNTSLKNGTYIYKTTFNRISIPFITKWQYEIANKVNIYLGFGPKLNINITPPVLTSYLNKKIISYDNNPRELKEKEYNIVDLDLNFVLGFEQKIAKVHYVGLRLGYDVNLLQSLNKKIIHSFETPNEDWVMADNYIDNFAISLTYRYKFLY